MNNWSYHPFFIRLLNWEFWNNRIIYAPLYPYWLWLSLKARSFFFLTAANPSIRNGGFIMESKNDVYKLLPDGCYPATCYFRKGINIESLWGTLQHSGIPFPLIAKPDYGERGLAVKKIDDEKQLQEYAEKIPVDFLIQKYIDYEHEAGIFYYRNPSEKNGKLSGIVYKEPITITGDGKHTIEELIKSNKRFRLQWNYLKKIYEVRLKEVLSLNEKIILLPYGNHARGSKFTDVSYKINDNLTATIDRLCNNIPGFYFGRLDIRFKDWQLLEEGKDFSIIEVNGSGSEPTHIYDPAHSIFFAWKEIIKHWNILYRISKANNKRGVQYLSMTAGYTAINAFRKIEQRLSSHTW